MSRQLKVSDDVHLMLHLLKSWSSTTNDEVIRDLIEDACPDLPDRLEQIAHLERDDPSEWAYEMHELQQDILQNYTVDRLLRKRERDKERTVEKYLKQKEREKEEAIERHIEQQGGNQVEQVVLPDSEKPKALSKRKRVKK